MKKANVKILIGALALSSAVFSCSKSETGENSAAASETSAEKTSTDPVSYAAKQDIKDKKFVKTADVDMEVKDVYDATIKIEKSLKDLGGFVTKSHLTSNVVSEETYNISDENAVLVKKFQSENSMQVKVPTENLSDFLQFVNDSKLFLNHRNISAEDVTANINLQKLSAQKNQKTAENISEMNAGKDKADIADENMQQANEQKISAMQLEDNLKYSTIDIFIKEPKVRTAEIPVTNTASVDNKYKFNFFHDVKNALIEGFYFIQKLIVLLITIWPLWLIIGGILYILKLRNRKIKPNQP